jgi:hypothetical protein
MFSALIIKYILINKEWPLLPPKSRLSIATINPQILLKSLLLSTLLPELEEPLKLLRLPLKSLEPLKLLKPLKPESVKLITIPSIISAFKALLLYYQSLQNLVYYLLLRKHTLLLLKRLKSKYNPLKLVLQFKTN